MFTLYIKVQTTISWMSNAMPAFDWNDKMDELKISLDR